MFTAKIKTARKLFVQPLIIYYYASVFYVYVFMCAVANVHFPCLSDRLQDLNRNRYKPFVIFTG